MDRIGIVATIGPATDSTNLIKRLISAGTTMMRLNGSHNSLSWHASTISKIREVESSMPILMDIPGRKIRTLQLKHEPSFGVGDQLILTGDKTHNGETKVPIGYTSLHKDVKKGDVVYADDGTLKFIVSRIKNTDVVLTSQTEGKLKSRKGINVPGVKLRTPLVTARDKKMIRFCQEHKVDYVGISFVESKDHIQKIRKCIGDASYPRIVSKVENLAGLKNAEEIVMHSDAVMIDRGDLSVETNLESLGLYQKDIIQTTKKNSIPVIVATEILHSMIESSQPTKAEVLDITNAVIDGCSSLMLSGETAVGRYPVEAVAQMRSIVRVVEGAQATYDANANIERRAFVGEGEAKAIALLTDSLSITKIVAITRTGFAARVLATQGATVPILAVSDDGNAARSFNFLPGVKGRFYKRKFSSSDLSHLLPILEELWRFGDLNAKDKVLVTGVAYPGSGSRMNFIETHRMHDLIKKFKWKKTS